MWSFSPQDKDESRQVRYGLILQMPLAAICGVCVGCVTALLVQGSAVANREFREFIRIEFPERSPGFCAILAVSVTIATGVGGAVARGWFPECAGDGLNSTKIAMALKVDIPFRVGLIRALLSSLVVVLGGPVGIIAPSLHVGAAVSGVIFSAFRGLFALCGGRENLQPASRHINPRRPGWRGCLRYIRNVLRQSIGDFKASAAKLVSNEVTPTMHLLGISCAISAAFGSPFCGAMYVVEDFIDIRVWSATFGVLCLGNVLAATASYVLHVDDESLVLGAVSGACSENGSPTAVLQVAMIWLFLSLSIAGIVGIVGHCFSRGVLILRERLILSIAVRDELHPLLCGLVAALLTVVAYVLTSGDERAWDSGFGPLAFAMSSSGDLWAPPVHHDVTLGLLKLLCAMVVGACDGPGGLFVPLLVSGGLIGSALGDLLGRVVSDGALAMTDEMLICSQDGINGRALISLGAALGASGLFAACMRLPLTAAAVTYQLAQVRRLHPVAAMPLLLTPTITCLIAATLEKWDLHDAMLLQDGIDPFNIHRTIRQGVNTVPSMVGGLGRGRTGSCTSKASEKHSEKHSEKDLDFGVEKNQSSKDLESKSRKTSTSSEVVQWFVPPPVVMTKPGTPNGKSSSKISSPVMVAAKPSPATRKTSTTSSSKSEDKRNGSPLKAAWEVSGERCSSTGGIPTAGQLSFQHDEPSGEENGGMVFQRLRSKSDPAIPAPIKANVMAAILADPQGCSERSPRSHDHSPTPDMRRKKSVAMACMDEAAKRRDHCSGTSWDFQKLLLQPDHQISVARSSSGDPEPKCPDGPPAGLHTINSVEAMRNSVDDAEAAEEDFEAMLNSVVDAEADEEEPHAWFIPDNFSEHILDSPAHANEKIMSIMEGDEDLSTKQAGG